jgi:hypothetical protein
MKPPFVAFNLDGSGEDLLSMTTVKVNSQGVPRQPFEIPFGGLESLDDRGLEATAALIGKSVLAELNRWHPDVFSRYPNLIVPIPVLQKHQFPLPPTGE